MSIRDGPAGRQNYLKTGEVVKSLCSAREQFPRSIKVLLN